MDETMSLGTWIRRRRKALDLTQDDLARMVGCSKEMIRKIESDARRPSVQIATLLARHLQLAADEHQAFVRAARAELAVDRLPPATHSVPRPEFVAAALPGSLPALSFPPPPTRPPHNLPAPLTALIGREQEMSELIALLSEPDVRLVTLTGPGGVGKTHLALQVAADALIPIAGAAPPLGSQPERGSGGDGHFPDGAWLVDLALLRDPALVASAIGRVLGVLEIAGAPIDTSLKRFLSARQLLLVLDNFEHLLDAAPLVSDLLHAAPGLKVLATSRAPLGLSGEHDAPVEPLDEAPAAALFVAQALLEVALALCREAGARQGTAKALVQLGRGARLQGYYTRAVALEEEGLALFREIDDAEGMIVTLLSLGDAALDQGDTTTAIRWFQESATLSQKFNDQYNRNWAMIMLARIAYVRRNGEQAQTILEECLTIARSIGDLHAVAAALIEVGRVARLDNDIARAVACFSESLALLQDLGSSEFIASGLEGLAGIAAVSGQPERAARLFGAAEALRAFADIPLPPVLRADYDRDVTAARAQLDELAFAAAWAEGRALPLERAIGEALAPIPDPMTRWQGDKVIAAHPVTLSPSPVTRRGQGDLPDPLLTDDKMTR